MSKTKASSVNYPGVLLSMVEKIAGGQAMQYDDAKVEDAVLALLGVFKFENGRA